MSKARSAFLERIGSVRNAITDFGLQDLPPSTANESKNRSVRIIRNGLAVQCFNIFEDFSKARFGELVDQLSARISRFEMLPVKLQEAATVRSVAAIHHQARRKDSSSKILYTQDYSTRIASTVSGALRLPEIAFFHGASNISEQEFGDCLASFAIKTPWLQLSGVASRAGLSAIPAKNVFDSLSERRHNAAHNAGAAVSESDLLQSIGDAIALAVGFDVLASRAVELIARQRLAAVAGVYLLNDHATLPLRFVRLVNGRYCEVREGAKKSSRTASDWKALLPDAARRTERSGGGLLVFDDSNALVHWACH